MAKLLKLRRGTTSQHSSFTGAEGEVTVDTDKETLVVHNGSTAGGFPLARADHPDSQKTRWGTGNDLEIYHDGGNSWVKEAGTGALYIDTNGSVIKITHTGGNETMANFYKDGAVELNHNNSQKLATTANGISVTGRINLSDNLDMPDSAKVILGTGDDLQLYHNGTNAYFLNSTGNMIITNMDPDDDNNIHLRARQNEDSIVCYNDASTDIYYDGAKKFETQSGGAKVTGRLTATGGFFVGDGGDNDTSVSIGANNDLRLYHSGSHSYIKDRGTGNLFITSNETHIGNAANTEDCAVFTENGSVKLYYNNIKKFETYDNGVIVYGSEGGAAYVNLHADEGDNNDDKWRFYAATNGYLHIQNYTSGSWDNNVRILGEGHVSLYYDDAKKLETTAGGAEVFGDLKFGDSKYAYFGNSNDLRIYHNGNNSFLENTLEGGHLFLRNNGPVDSNIYIQARAGEDSITCENDGAVNLYFNNLKKLETWNDGIIVRGREGSMGGVDIYADEGDNNADKWRLKADNAGQFLLQNYSTGSWVKNINVGGNNAVELYYGGNKKIETASTGIIVTGNVDITGSYSVDNGEKFVAGDSSDVQLYHDGHSKLIHNGDGHFYIKTEGADEDLVLNAERNAYIQCSSGEHGVICKEDAEVELYYNNAVKFETRGFGVRTFGHLGVNVDPGNTPNTRAAFVAIGDSDTGVAQNGDGQLELWANNQEIMNIDTGEVTFYKPAIPSANNTHDLGSTSYRWRNLYVNDAHFSNEGSSNSVDGTWGDWTLQEGEDTIFMLNNRTGKKYKMNLTEVS